MTLADVVPEQIADRLCCSFGQDLQDSLFSRHTFARRNDGSHPHVRPVVLFGLNLAYVGALVSLSEREQLSRSHLFHRVHSCA